MWISASFSSGASSTAGRELLVQHLLVKEDDQKLLLELMKRASEGWLMNAVNANTFSEMPTPLVKCQPKKYYLFGTSQYRCKNEFLRMMIIRRSNTIAPLQPYWFYHLIMVNIQCVKSSPTKRGSERVSILHKE